MRSRGSISRWSPTFLACSAPKDVALLVRHVAEWSSNQPSRANPALIEGAGRAVSARVSSSLFRAAAASARRSDRARRPGRRTIIPSGLYGNVCSYSDMAYPRYLRDRACELRTEKHLSLIEIADRLGLPKTTVYYWIKDLPLGRPRRATRGQRTGNRGCERSTGSYARLPTTKA